MFKDTDKFELFWQQALRQGYCIFKGLWFYITIFLNPKDLLLDYFYHKIFLFELHTINVMENILNRLQINKQILFYK